MTEAVVQDWLNECSSLPAGQLQSYSAVLDHNEELVTAIQTVLEDRSRFPNLLDPICDQLFTFYRSREASMQKFTLQFLPSLMYVHLSAAACGEKKSCKSIETLLLGMYNLAVVNEKDEQVVFAFRLPSLAQSSLYHEPPYGTITAAALRRFEEVNTKPVTWGPNPQMEVINAQNRMKILTALLFVFNRHIATFQRSALKNICRVASKIVMQGFPRPGHHQRSSSFGGETNYLPKLPPRIPVSSQFLLELTSGLYFAMFNDYGQMAMQAIEDIHYRSCFQCFSEVLLVTNAIKNSSHYSGHTSEGPMGISVALSPATTTVTTVNKSMITNASFRTKKLPDDIPIVSGGEGATVTTTDGNQLVSISEEKEEEASNFTPRAASLRGKDAVTKNLQKLGIGKKTKVKTNPDKPASDKKVKSVKSPLVQNGDASDSTDSPQGVKRRSTGENGDAISNSCNERNDVGTPDSLDTTESHSLEEHMRRLEVSPTAHKKMLEFDEKPLMQVSSV